MHFDLRKKLYSCVMIENANYYALKYKEAQLWKAT